MDLLQAVGGRVKVQFTIVEGGHVLSMSDFRNSTPAVINDHSPLLNQCFRVPGQPTTRIPLVTTLSSCETTITPP